MIIKQYKRPEAVERIFTTPGIAFLAYSKRYSVIFYRWISSIPLCDRAPFSTRSVIDFNPQTTTYKFRIKMFHRFTHIA